MPEHFSSKRCLHCGAECGNHPWVAERDRRMQLDERSERRWQETLDLARTRVEPAERRAERKAADDWFDRALKRPCEIRGLGLCSGCKRCLNRDGNAAPQMAIQLKRLLLGAGLLHRVSPEDAALQRMSNDIEA